MREAKVEVFEFDELSETARWRAINGAIQFMLEMPDENFSVEFRMACSKAESLRTPWFMGEYVWDFCKEEVISLCREYDYTSNGHIFSYRE